MNLNKIKEILDSRYDDPEKEQLIVEVLAEDEEVIMLVMRILDAERKLKKRLIKYMNLHLSKAQLCLEEPHLEANKFIQGEITQFYKKYEKFVGNPFKQPNWLENVKLITEEGFNIMDGD